MSILRSSDRVAHGMYVVRQQFYAPSGLVFAPISFDPWAWALPGNPE